MTEAINQPDQPQELAGGEPDLFSKFDPIIEMRRDLLASGPVTHVFAGHIHRTITATVDGLPMTVFKSPCHQMPMVLGAEGSGHSVPEPGAYGILTTRGPNVVVHFEDFTLPETEVGQSAV